MLRMNENTQIGRILKGASAIAFAISFIMAMNLFGEIGRSIIPLQTARIIFIASGGVAMILNLVTFQSGKFHPAYNLMYWLGSIVVFLGLVAFLMNWPYAKTILIGGMIVVGISFFLPKGLSEKKEKNPDLLDDYS